MERNNPFTVEPSVICCDLCNLETEVRRLEGAGATALHIDVLDGAFSPSLPVGIDTFLSLSRRCRLPFDVHIMSLNNEWFVEKCIDMKPRRICIHWEGERHVARILSRIRSAGISPGLAIAPATSLDVAVYALRECDFVLLMRIEPGYASVPNEKEFVFMDEKIQDCRAKLDAIRPHMGIVVDGRVDFQDIPRLVALGADTLVCGSKSIFLNSNYEENYKKAIKLYRQAMEARI